MMGGFDGMGGFGLPWMLIPFLYWGGFLVLMAWTVVRFFPERRGVEWQVVQSRPTKEYALSLEGGRNHSRGSV